MDSFWDRFYRKSLERIPWQTTQADWFQQLLEQEEITGETALDLGCGTGQKSLALVQLGGFRSVVGIDISEQAVQIARTKTKDVHLDGQCSFVCHDLTEEGFPNLEQFDFILDWATLHCIPEVHRKAYVQFIERHCKAGGRLLVRAFAGTDPNRVSFDEEIDGMTSKIYLLDEEKIRKLFPQFRFLKRNISRPKTKPDLYFIELLMERNG